jgi:hypothetical protein
LKQLKYLLVTINFLLLASGMATAQDLRFGIEGGWAAADLGAKNTATSLATLTSRTVRYTEEAASPAGRIFVEVPVQENISAEVGYFATTSLDATYTFSGTTVTAKEGATANGIDFGAKLNVNDTMFFRAGLHRSKLNQSVTVSISGTSYTASLSQSGTGSYFGGGFNLNDNLSLGVTQYLDLGGLSGADATFFFIGYRF